MMKTPIVILFIFMPVILLAQGNLLIIGGGSETMDEGGWSTEPYSWAVNQSANKKVALISFSQASDWMQNYFTVQCGALAAKDFKINSQSIANSQSTYDSLMAYDVLFLKGGDQWNYYATYKNTLTQQALQDKFEQGGVICGTSAGLAVMSEVIFTAQNGTVYPDECIENPNNQYVNLENDFLDFFQGYIFDSHFTHRGRAGRRMGFLAHWKLNRNEIIKGIGIDETTALAITPEKIGTVYGTGAANFYLPGDTSIYHLDEEMLIVDSLRIMQLLHGCTIDFNSGEIGGLNEDFSPVIAEENGNYIILASGGDAPNDNTAMLQELALQGSGLNDKILIITSSNQNTAETFKTNLINLGANQIEIYSAVAAMSEDADFEQAISEADKFLFVNNEFYILENFLSKAGNGPLLADRIRRDGKVIAFVGDNSRFAGKIVVENYLLNNAAENGSLIFKDGLNLLKTTVIMPNSYQASDMFMNAAAAVPYAMLQSGLRFGVWLTQNNYMKYAPANQNTYITSYGTAPAMIIELNNTKGGFASTTYSDQYETPAMIAGFKAMNIQLINSPVKIKTGSHLSPYSIDKMQKGNAFPMQVFPNPTSDFLQVRSENHKTAISLYTASGQMILSKNTYATDHSIGLSQVPAGIYLLKARNQDQKISTQKISIRK
jgi:cyanophycinase